MNSPKSLQELFAEFVHDVKHSMTPTAADLVAFERRLDDLEARRLAAPEHEWAELDKARAAAREWLGRARGEREHPTITTPRPSAPERDWGWDGFDR